ncbi:nucleotidyltransferase domain-containing protein [Pelomonas sp. P7]|uniref:Nucleotidyltransferase domain-containing protein n=1 Tax=Pelomonas caseinilytica TaxID=2906763 RepID=A0ABS8XMB1_9BURK|nr:nucleotidyltransferase domain-containing protein [Pelomonas sp. P7]MCE4540057.1 nucleotidyltransferase domain-containing protein [Pelomonas sp. P7]
MHLSIARAQDRLADLCRRHHIARLEVFGSAARGEDFEPDSDADLLVAFEAGVRVGLQEWETLRLDLEQVLGRPVDLVQEGAVANPFVRRQIDRDRELLFAA